MRNIGTILSNFDIENICNFLGIPLVGIFTKDQLPNVNTRGFLVVNLDDFGNPGTHWVAVSTYDKNICYYDSYGEHPPVSVDNYIKRVTGQKKYTINQIQIQSLRSTYCGWYCIAFFYCLMNLNGGIKYKLDKFNDYFNNEDLNDNYDKLLRFFQKIVNQNSSKKSYMT